ncbi:hypothetical protein HispidOSU_005473 [Sigmodon hispidus]
MTRWENVVGFGMSQQNNYYFIWQGEQLRSHSSLGCHCDSSDEQPHGFYHLSCYSDGPTLNGNGPSPLSVYETPEPLAGPWDLPEENTTLAGNQDKELLRDPNLHLNIEELNKKFMAESEELYDSLMSCHWQPLDTILSNIPDEAPPNEKQVFTMPSI